MLRVYTKKLGTTVVLFLIGRIVIGETATLRDAVLSQSATDTLVLDLACVNIIDAAGFGFLLKLREEMQSRGINFKLTNLTKTVDLLFEITRLNSVFEVTSVLRGVQRGSFPGASSVRGFAACA